MTFHTRGAGDPGQPEGAPGEVPVGEDVGEAELLVVGLGVQVEKVGDVHVGHAELILVNGHTTA